GHVHRHARLDLEGVDAVVACLDGDCDAEGYAGTGVRGVTGRMGRNDGTLGDALTQGGYNALARSLDMAPADVVGAVEAAALTGRGGAHFPAATKWRFVAQHGGP